MLLYACILIEASEVSESPENRDRYVVSLYTPPSVSSQVVFCSLRTKSTHWCCDLCVIMMAAGLATRRIMVGEKVPGIEASMRRKLPRSTVETGEGHFPYEVQHGDMQRFRNASLTKKDLAGGFTM